MQYINIYHKMPARRVIKDLQRAVADEDISAGVKHRQGVIKFYKEFGIRGTIEAYKISRTTLYRWQKKYKEYGRSGLCVGDRTPHKKRSSCIRQEVKDFILVFRQEHIGACRYVIKPHLDKHCLDNKIETISLSSIGRVIKELKHKGLLLKASRLRFDARSGKLTEYKVKYKDKGRRKGYKPTSPGDLLQIDSVHCFVDGIKRYLMTAIDVNSKFAFALSYKTLNNANAKDFMEKLIEVSPYQIKRVQTDNGLEFYKSFDNCLTKHNITHFYNYPRSPKSNAYIERFNRTLREQFINCHDDFCDNDKTNKNLINYLLWYNTQKPHKSINFTTPLNYAIFNPIYTAQKSHMLWTANSMC